MMVLRTNNTLWEEIKVYKGMSIFRRKKADSFTTVPLPPGALFVGNFAYGTWTYANSGEKIWRFHKAYRNFPKMLHWGDFRPSFEFYKIMKVHLENKAAFFGTNNEFGEKGFISQMQIKPKIDHKKITRNSWKHHLGKFVRIPPWRNQPNQPNG